MQVIFGEGSKCKIATVAQELEIEVLTSEQYSYCVQVTSNPVERGLPVSDHVQKEAKKYSLSGVFSMTPVEVQSAVKSAAIAEEQNQKAFGNRVKRYFGFDTGNAQSVVDAINSGIPDNTQITTAFNFFKNLYENPELITIATKYDSYDNLIMTSFEVSRDSSSGSSLTFSCSFQEVRIVSTETTDIKKPKKVQTSQKKDLGKQTPTTPNPTEQKQADKDMSSFLYDGAKQIGLIK